MGGLGEGLHISSSDSTLGDSTHFLSFEEGRRGKEGNRNGEAGREGQPDKKYTSPSWKWGRGRVQGLERPELQSFRGSPRRNWQRLSMARGSETAQT